jgi:SAM-dependent methyltransferase
VTADRRLLSDRFPRASAYHPDWVLAGVSGAAHPLWMTEWLIEALDLQPGMRVLDLGCGRALSSIFLHRELGVQVWATDLWFSASENQRRIDDAGATGGVVPVHADARALPFDPDFFDAIVSIDSFFYYGTDDHYLAYLARFVKPGGAIGIAGAAVMAELDAVVPGHLERWWTPDLWCLHSAGWWRQHWERTGLVTVETADTLPDGWRLWREWVELVAPENQIELDALSADAGRHLGYARVVGRRRMDADVPEPIATVTTRYAAHPLLRSET